MNQALAAAHGQGWTQIGELLLAFALSSIVGLERQVRGKSAGLRTQAIVGTASALFLLVSKYGFADVISAGNVVLDPSRVAGQVVSGIGFVGAGLIITRRGAIVGLTTAAAVWETAAIGMAAGAGLPLLACTVTVLHFVIVLGYSWLGRWLPGSVAGETEVDITYIDGRGVLRDLLAACTKRSWSIASLAIQGGPGSDLGGQPGTTPGPGPHVTVALRLTGAGTDSAAAALGEVDGVVRVDRRGDDGD
jgi:putative Mg2+ transporter-C (MgtC) family protein